MMLGRKNRTGTYLLMIAPAVLVYLFVVAYPILFSVFMSFTDMDFSLSSKTAFVGLREYREIFSDPLFYKGLWNNLFIVFISVMGQIPIGLILAYWIFRRFVRGRKFFQAMVFIPMIISTIVIGILWRNIFGVRGIATSLVRHFTGNEQFFFTWWEKPGIAMLPVGFVILWIYTGFYMLIFLANLQKIDKGILESAHIDGASETRIFFSIILPYLTTAIVVNCILAISGSLKGFDLIFALAPNNGIGISNNNLVLPTYLYTYAFLPRKYPFGSAIGNIIILISFLIMTVAKFIGDYFDPFKDKKIREQGKKWKRR